MRQGVLIKGAGARGGVFQGVRERLEKLGKQPYMCAAHLKVFREILVAEEAVYAEMVRESAAVQADDRVTAADESDVASRAEDVAINFERQRFALKRLSSIRHALAKIEQGEYGYCVDTGDEIGLDRLAAYPFAERTVEAQTRAEKSAEKFAVVRGAA